jgi:FtsP/CotA-like multicopper oxidase with cupredoxin domain
MRYRLEGAVPRRALLRAAGGLVLAAAFRMGTPEAAAVPLRLVAAPGRAPLRGDTVSDTEVWAYNGEIPGPTLRVPQGKPVRILVENRLDEETTVHWHGIRLPNAMDGVPGLTQRPIKPGETFVYTFTPPDAGTFWYHPHADSLRQLGRGLAGALIVEGTAPIAVDRDVLWVLSDWRLTADGAIAGGFGSAMDAAMSGRIGNTVTLNGRPPADLKVRAGQRIRLRLVNTALARIMALRFTDHRPTIVAIDGQPCEPHEPDDGRLLLGPAMRIDLVLDLVGTPGRRYPVIDDFYEGLAAPLTNLAYTDQAPLARSDRAPLSLPRNPIPEPDLASALRHELRLQGGMMGGGMMSGMGGMSGMSGGAAWNINGMSMTGDGAPDMPPLLTLQKGQSHVLTLVNETAWWHPIHLHGHSFKILQRNGAPVPHRQWCDTVLMAPSDRIDCAFVADNPGDWMLHCHVMDHQVAGLMTVLRVA